MVRDGWGKPGRRAVTSEIDLRTRRCGYRFVSGNGKTPNGGQNLACAVSTDVDEPVFRLVKRTEICIDRCQMPARFLIVHANRS